MIAANSRTQSSAILVGALTIAAAAALGFIIPHSSMASLAASVAAPVVIGILAWQRPGWLFILLAAWALVDTFIIATGALPPRAITNSQIVLGVFAVWRAALYWGGRPEDRVPTGVWLIAGCVLIMFLSMAINELSLIAGIEANLGTFLYAGFYVLTISLQPSDKQVERAIRLLLAFGCVTVLVAVAQQVFGAEAFFLTRTDPSAAFLNSGTSAKRSTSIFFHPNGFGNLISPIVLLSYALATRTRVPSTHGVLVVLTLLAGLIISFSREAWIGTAAATGLTFAAGRRRVGAVALAGVAVVLLAVPAVRASFLDRTSTSSAETEFRIHTILASAAMLRDYPFFGIGSGYFTPQGLDARRVDRVDIPSKYGLEGLFTENQIFQLDSFWAQFAAENGIVASLLLLVFFGYHMRLAVEVSRRAESAFRRGTSLGIGMALIAIFIEGWTAPNLNGHPVTMLFWTGSGLVALWHMQLQTSLRGQTGFQAHATIGQTLQSTREVR